MSFSVKRTILFGDCDPAGIVFTPRVSYFVVEAIHDFLGQVLGGPAVRQLFALGILPPARALSIEFLARMAWDDVIDITVSCKEVATTSFTFLITGHHLSGVTCFQATLTQVCIDPESKRPVPVPEALRRALSGDVSAL